MHLFWLYLLNDFQTMSSTIHFYKPLLCVTLICGDWSNWLISFKAAFVSAALLCVQPLPGKQLFLRSFPKIHNRCTLSNIIESMLLYTVSQNPCLITWTECRSFKLIIVASLLLSVNLSCVVGLSLWWRSCWLTGCPYVFTPSSEWVTLFLLQVWFTRTQEMIQRTGWQRS